MIVYRIAKSEYAEDLSGRGSFLFGGRWNSEGIYALYTSTHRSLAFLELIAHLPLELVSQAEYKVISIEIPEPINKYPIFETLDDARSKGNEILKAKEHLYFDVPSIIFPEERNIIINPIHQLASGIKIIETQKLVIDSRLV